MSGEVTQLLERWRGGDREALERLIPKLYDTLRDMAAQRLRREGEQQTLEPTALVHEALLRLLGGESDPLNRAHFLALAAMHMRSVLVDHARARLAHKRGGDAVLVTLTEARSQEGGRIELDLLALDQALTRLAEQEPAKAELVKLRYFAGLSLDDAAACLAISPATAKRWWAVARAWLFADLAEADEQRPA